MRPLLIGILLVLVPHDGQAQAARIGRLPLLDTLSARLACVGAAPTPFLRQTGTVRILMLTDSATGRVLTVGVGADQRPRYFLAMMGTRENRRSESESITANFHAGRVTSGDRSAFTGGTPSRLSDDRRSGLLASDTSSIAKLAPEVVRRCRDT